MKTVTAAARAPKPVVAIGDETLRRCIDEIALARR